MKKKIVSFWAVTKSGSVYQISNRPGRTGGPTFVRNGSFSCSLPKMGMVISSSPSDRVVVSVGRKQIFLAKANLEGDFRRFLYFLPHTSQVKGLFPIEEETKMMECACTDGIPFDPRWSRETEKVLSALRKNLDFTVFDD